MNPRQKEILTLFAEKNYLSVAELSQILDVSDVTIRSDLDILAENGKVLRTHGGAELVEHRVQIEKSFELRRRQNIEQKQGIGKKAAEFLNPLESIILDSR